MALKAVSAPLGSPVGGSGTPGTIPVWSGSGTTLTDSIVTQTGASRINIGSGAYAGASLDGVRLANGINSYYTASDGTRTSILGADGNAFVGTLTNHSFVIRSNNANALTVNTSQRLLAAVDGTASLPVYANSTGVSGLYFPSAATAAIAANGAVAATFSRVAGAGVALGGTTGLIFDASGTQQGLKLPATPGNADTQTLDCYLDGGASGGATWAPVDNSGAGLTFTVTSARYMRIGRLVLASFDITFPATASGAQAKISLPVTAQAVWQGASIGFGPNVPGLSAAVNNADLNFWTYGAATTNAALSGARLIVSMSYFAS
jgi:hypothetical protein